MKKQGRNERCACGSGKKYKHCCGSATVVPFNRAIITDELMELEDEFIKYNLTHYIAEFIQIEEEIKASTNIWKASKNDQQHFKELLIPYIAFSYRLPSGQTMFDRFYEKKKHEVHRTAVKKSFAAWKEPIHSLFKIVELDEEANKMLLMDQFTNKTYPLNMFEPIGVSLSDFLAATIVPYDQFYHLVVGALTIPKTDKHIIKEIVDRFTADDGLKQVNYPSLLAQLLIGEPSVFDEDDMPFIWLTEEHEMVANAFVYFADGRYPDEAIFHAIEFWNDYCNQEMPAIYNVEANAAALEYFVGKHIYQQGKLTQREIAAIYNVSVGTISSRYQQLLRFDREPNIADMDMGVLATLQEQLQSQVFDSEEDAGQFIADFLGSGMLEGLSPERNVYELIGQAANASGAERVALLNEVLDQEPDNIDAHLLLAVDKPTAEETINALQQTVAMAEKQLGKAFIKENKGYFWGLFETRPYMRTQATLADAYEQIGEKQKAIAIYEKLLELNPNDNQGIREYILPLYIEMDQLDKAKKLIEQFDEDSVMMSFSQALIHYLGTGDKLATIELVRKAIRTNPYVLDYIIGNEALPKTIPDIITPGKESEAIVYAHSSLHLWQPYVKELFLIGDK